MKILIVGAGFYGSVLARELSDAKYDVHVIDKRSHIAGNAYDYVNSKGIRVHKYGPHILHTNNAKVVDGIVEKVIVAEAEFFDTFVDESAGKWIQTSYNTYGGEHTLGGTPLRKNYAGIGFTYDAIKDAFIPPQPYSSWTLNEQTCLRSEEPRLNSSHITISYAVFCLKKKKQSE